MALSLNQFKNGLTVLVDEGVYQIIEVQHVKPGKGAAFVRTRLRNMKNANIIEKTFRGDEKIEEAFVEEKKLQYLYHKDQIYFFMDQENFEEQRVSKETLGDNVLFLKDNLEVTALVYGTEFLEIKLPNFIELKITYAESGIKGDTVKVGTKPATLETGAVIQVPLFIENGDTIKIDTRSKAYIERITY